MIPSVSKRSLPVSVDDSKERYPLRSKKTKVTFDPSPILIEYTPTFSPKVKIDRTEQRERFYWNLVSALRKEHHKGALGKKWALKVQNAAHDLYDENSTEFRSGFTKMSRGTLTNLIKDRIFASYSV